MTPNDLIQKGGGWGEFSVIRKGGAIIMLSFPRPSSFFRPYTAIRWHRIVLIFRRSVLVMKSDAGPLCSTWFDPQGRLRLPIGARVWFALYLKGPSFAVPPGPALVGLASPGGFGSGSVRLWRSPPGALGVPSVVFCSPLFFLFFLVLVRDHLWVARCFAKG